MTDVNFPQDFYLDDVGVWRLKKEKLAELEKPKPITNEEWFTSLSTEEKAKVLCDVVPELAYENDGVWDEKKFVEWLKQPHTNE